MAETTNTYSAYEGQVVATMMTYTSYRSALHQDEIDRELPDCAALQDGDTVYALYVNFRLWVSRLRGLELKPNKKTSARAKALYDVFADWWRTAGSALEARDYRSAWEALLDTPPGVVSLFMLEACDTTLRQLPEAPKELQVDDNEAKALGEDFLAVVPMPS